MILKHAELYFLFSIKNSKIKALESQQTYF